MAEKLVTVARFHEPALAHLCKTRLELTGVEAIVSDEHIIGLNWFYSLALGGVKVKVRESEAARAIELLGEEFPEAELSEEVKATAPDELRCPRCHSQSVYFQRYARKLSLAVVVLLGLPLLFPRRRWECRDCGHQWR
ncbi:MAG: transposase [Candidatus Acidoferrales bacterium]